MPTTVRSVGELKRGRGAIGDSLQVREILDNKDGSIADPSGHPLPPCIVMERGESLDKWSERAKPDRMQACTVRCLISPCILYYIHVYFLSSFPVSLLVFSLHGMAYNRRMVWPDYSCTTSAVLYWDDNYDPNNAQACIE